MRRVVIVTSGSRGDVQPYCALGLALHATGQAAVTVCTERRMETFVKSFAELKCVYPCEAHGGEGPRPAGLHSAAASARFDVRAVVRAPAII
jgi:UDP:flavonoid glycosyltransferase YjiC (YdhE family)